VNWRTDKRLANGTISERWIVRSDTNGGHPGRESRAKREHAEQEPARPVLTVTGNKQGECDADPGTNDGLPHARVYDDPRDQT